MIKEIVFEINKKEIKLTVDEAKELKEHLSMMFGEKRYYDWRLKPYIFFTSSSNIEYDKNAIDYSVKWEQK